MAITKDAFENYVKQRESNELKEKLKDRKKYKHHRVFDPPPELHEDPSDTLGNNTYIPLNKSEQTENERYTNHKQTGDERYTQHEQMDNKRETNSIQTDNKLDTIGKQIENKTETNGQQTVYKKAKTNTLSSLVGIQKKVIFALFEACSNINSNVTHEITLEYLASRVDETKNTMKTTIYRLKSKGCITLHEYKNGRAGWSKYKLDDDLYYEILNSFNNDYINEQDKRVDIEWLTKDPSSSNNYINNTTTNNQSDKLPEEWNNIVFDALSDIGFSKTQIKQLYNLNTTTPEIVQESINHFAFGIKYNDLQNKYSKPLNVLMGVLRKGEGWIEPNYKSPKEIAQEQFLEQKKKERERIKQLEKEAFDLAFQEWQDQLSESEAIEIGGTKPEYKKQRMITPEDRLQEHFKKHIWPEKKHEYLVSSG